MARGGMRKLPFAVVQAYRNTEEIKESLNANRQALTTLCDELARTLTKVREFLRKQESK